MLMTMNNEKIPIDADLAPAILNNTNGVSRDMMGNREVHIKWSNKYDCPEGYTYNSSGYVITNLPYPKIRVSVAPWQLKDHTPLSLYKWNLIALLLLNPTAHIDTLTKALNGIMHRALGHAISNDELTLAVKAATGVRKLEDISNIPNYILKFDTIWYSADSGINSIRDIVKIRDDETIDIVREIMSIDTRWKTKEVSYNTDRSQYIIRQYWKRKGLNTTARTEAAIVEANEYLIFEKNIPNPTKVEIAREAGISVREVHRNKELLERIVTTNKMLSQGIDKALAAVGEEHKN